MFTIVVCVYYIYIYLSFISHCQCVIFFLYDSASILLFWFSRLPLIVSGNLLFVHSAWEVSIVVLHFSWHPAEVIFRAYELFSSALDLLPFQPGCSSERVPSSRVALRVYDKFIIGFGLATSRFRNTVLHFLMPIGIFRIGKLSVFVNLWNFAKFLNWEFHNFVQTYRAREFQIEVKHSFLIRATFVGMFFRRGISISRKLRIFNNYISSIMENRDFSNAQSYQLVDETSSFRLFPRMSGSLSVSFFLDGTCTSTMYSNNDRGAQ